MKAEDIVVCNFTYKSSRQKLFDLEKLGKCQNKWTTE